MVLQIIVFQHVGVLQRFDIHVEINGKCAYILTSAKPRVMTSETSSFHPKQAQNGPKVDLNRLFFCSFLAFLHYSTPKGWWQPTEEDVPLKGCTALQYKCQLVFGCSVENAESIIAPDK